GCTRRSPHSGPIAHAAARPAPSDVPAARTPLPAVRRRTSPKVGCPALRCSSNFLRPTQSALEDFAQTAIDGLARPEYSRPDRPDRTIHGRGDLLIGEPFELAQYDRG